MSSVTTLGIGGNAKQFCVVSSQGELKEAIAYAKDNNLDYLVIGGGSNLLVSDEGVEKLVIKNSTSEIKIATPRQGGARNDEAILTVKSGTMLQNLVDFVIEHGLEGLQKLTGIPGTVGGAIYGNAGAYGQSISDHLVEVVILDPSPRHAELVSASSNQKILKQVQDDVLVLKKEDCHFSYRDSIFKKNNSIILEAKFALKSGNKAQMEQEAKNTIQQRLKKYPAGIKCPGSFFKNIIADNLPKEILEKIPSEKIVYGKIPAGTLLEMVGAKGDKLGDIEIASYHANLFINRGNGTAQDFYNLAKKYADKVYEKFGIILEPEVQFVNLPSLG